MECPQAKSLWAQEMQIINVGRLKQSMLIFESLENTEKQKEKEKPHIPLPLPQDSLFSSTCCFTQWKPPRTYRGTWQIHRWKMIWRERIDSVWYLATGWFNYFSNIKKISLLRSLNMNFKEIHKSSTKILWGGNEPFCTFMHLYICRGGRDSFSNSPHTEFPLWNSLTVLSKCWIRTVLIVLCGCETNIWSEVRSMLLEK